MLRNLEILAAFSQPCRFSIRVISFEERKDLEAADAAYRKVLELAPYGQLNDLAKEGLSRISEATFREKSPERPDAVMYCLGAMERFDGMPMGEVKKISMEIANFICQTICKVSPCHEFYLPDDLQSFPLPWLCGGF